MSDVITGIDRCFSMRSVIDKMLDKHEGLNNVRYLYKENGFEKLTKILYKKEFRRFFIYTVVVVSIITVLWLIHFEHSNYIVRVASGGEKFSILMLSVQVGVLALIYPITISTATFFSSDKFSSNRMDIEIYYQISLAKDIGLSGLMLVLFLILFNAYCYVFDSDDFYFYVMSCMLFICALFWFLFNVIGIIYFMLTSFNIISLYRRSDIRKKYFALVKLREEYRSILFMNAYWDFVSARTSYLATRDGAPECISNFKNVVYFVNFRPRLLEYVLRRWVNRCDKQNCTGAVGLSFLKPEGKPQFGEVVLCRRVGGLPFTWFEKKVVSFAFVFANYE